LSGDTELAASDTWEELMQEADQNGDGELDFDEFSQCVSALIEDHDDK
jgi:Ca2+-binding EF-hand superfamily protein